MCVCVRELFSFPSAAHFPNTQVCIGDHRPLFIIVTRFSLWGVRRGRGGAESICGDLLVAAASCLFITESQRTVHRLCTRCSVCRLLNQGNVKRMKTFCNLARQLDGCMHFQVGKLPYESVFPLPNRVSHDQSGSSEERKSWSWTCRVWRFFFYRSVAANIRCNIVSMCFVDNVKWQLVKKNTIFQKSASFFWK